MLPPSITKFLIWKRTLRVPSTLVASENEVSQTTVLRILRKENYHPYKVQLKLTGERYLEYLQNDLVPALAVIFSNENDPDIPDNTLWFQQDEAPPHYARSVRLHIAKKLLDGISNT
ncbi:hypothetical protein NQ318_021519 [Aromia moschata]|uniref:Uncharacterized protein n=1 Tax=Aromia moschata TaxID=1265417 RepID=A0AAV8ZE14_9CUCU|nr:hypothetical protein NQ318_021519 [Aromia moschata]